MNRESPGTSGPAQDWRVASGVSPALDGPEFVLQRIIGFAGAALGPRTPHKLVRIPGVPHDMGGAGVRFLAEFDMAIQWMIDTPVPAPPP